MQHDEAKITAGNLFTNPYNVTDTCNRRSCTLANRPFATIREYEGVFYLCMKANQQWGRLKLPRNYEKATQLINKQMMYWPPLLRQRVQYQLRMMTDMRKLAKKTRKEVKRKTRREEKAKKAAAAEKVTERELLQWLKERTYDPGSIVNPSIRGDEKETFRY